MIGLVSQSTFLQTAYDSQGTDTVFLTSFNKTLYSAVNYSSGSIIWRFLLPLGSRFTATAVLRRGETIALVEKDYGGCSLMLISNIGTILWDSDVNTRYCTSDVAMTVNALPWKGDEVVSILLADRVMALHDIGSLNPTTIEWLLNDVLEGYSGKDQQVILRSLPKDLKRDDEMKGTVLLFVHIDP